MISMPHKKPHPGRNKQVEGQILLANRAAKGDLERLECPNCGRASVSVWFTHPALSVYRTWFICTRCRFNFRAQNAGRPEYFTDDRVDLELEKRDASVVAAAKFKNPSSGTEK